MNGSKTAHKRICRGYSQGVCIWFDPLTVAAIDRTAAAAGQSRSDWVRRTLVRALGGDIDVTASAPERAPKGRQLPLPMAGRARAR